MTNEATKILRQLNLRDHLAAVKAARAIILDDYPANLLTEDLAAVAEYLQEQINYENSPSEGTI